MLLIVSGWSVSICFLIQNIYYIYHSIKIYKSHTINRKNIFSYEEDIKLNWLKILIYGYVIFVSVIVVFKLLGGHPSGFLYYLIIMIYLIYTGYNALKQENIYSVIQHQKAKLNELSDPIIDRNQLPTEKDKELKDRLLDLIEKEKVYLDQEINIFQLADQLNSNSKYLSQAINKGLNKTFIVFINEYRVKEARRLLTDEKFRHLTIESIAGDSGFNSVSAFNNAFKKFKGLTPSYYLKSILGRE